MMNEKNQKIMQKLMDGNFMTLRGKELYIKMLTPGGKQIEENLFGKEDDNK